MSTVWASRERLIALVLVICAGAVCWAWLGKMLWDMSVMPMDGAHATSASSPGYVAWLLVMWLVMMTAMMLPSSIPMTLVFADFTRSPATPTVAPRVALFVGGYLLAWGAFSVIAAFGQWSFEQRALLSPMAMAFKNDTLAAWVLVAAGIYQWTPLKHACLSKCRSPIGFFMTHWRDGWAGAVAMGWRHGLFCVGCCGALMLLLFVVGVMSAFWIVALTLVVVIEKVARRGELIARLVGVVAIVYGVWLMIGTAQ